MKNTDIGRSDEAAHLVHTLQDILSGATPTQIFQVCANIVGQTIVEVTGNHRQDVLDQSMAFGNILGRVIETTLTQMEEQIDDGTEEEETDEGDADVS